MIFPAFLQNAEARDIGINRFTILRQILAPEFLVFRLALFVLALFQIADQDFFEGSERLRIFRPESVMAVKLHNVVDHHDKTGGIDKTVIDVDVHSIVAFRHLYHRDLHHGNLRLTELFIGLFLQKSVGFPHGAIGEIQERDIPVIAFRNVLLYIPVFIRGSESKPKALIAPVLILNTSLQKIKIDLCLQTGKDTDVAAALSAGLPDGQILQHLTHIQWIKLFLHVIPPFFLIYRTETCEPLLFHRFALNFRAGEAVICSYRTFSPDTDHIRVHRSPLHRLPDRQYCAHLH